MLLKTDPSSSKTSIALVLVLLLVLVHSLFRLAITPPWAFSDEEGHFEVVQYLTRHWQWPTLATADLALRQQISDISLERHCDPDEPWTNTCVGVNQYDELPLFYILQALVQTAIPLPGLIARLYLARFVSLGLSLLAAWFTFQLALEVWDKRWKPAALAVVVMGTNFSYIGTMLAVNNDTLATCSVALLAWASVRLLKGKWTVGSWLLWLFAIAVCLLAKSSTLVTALLALVTIGLRVSVSWVPPKFLAMICAAAGLVGGVILVNWDGQPGWNVAAGYDPSSPAGARVLSLTSQAGAFQGLPPQSVEALRGQTITLQAFVYTREPAPVHLGIIIYPMFRAGQDAQVLPGRWTKVVLTTRIPENAQYVEVVMSSPQIPDTLWDGLALFDSSHSRQWLFNAEGEYLAPMFTPRVGNIFLAGRSLNDRLIFIYDFPRSLYYYPLEARYLFSTFWGGWGWNHVSLPKSVIGVYALVTGLSGLGLLFWWRTLIRQRNSAARLQLAVSLWLALLTGTVIAQSILRVDYPQATYPIAVFASARYAFPIMAPFSILIVAGLMQWTAFIHKPRWGYKFLAVAAVAAFLVGIHATLLIHIPSFRVSPRVMDPALFALLNH